MITPKIKIEITTEYKFTVTNITVFNEATYVGKYVTENVIQGRPLSLAQDAPWAKQGGSQMKKIGGSFNFSLKNSPIHYNLV